MLRVRYIKNAAGAVRYLTEADYYCPDRQVIALWDGKLRDRLGLPEVLDRDAFSRAVHGFNPVIEYDQEGQPLPPEFLTQREKGNRRGGVEFMFSVPKSVSAIALMSPNENLRRAVEQAGFEAATETMRDMEQLFAVRDQRGGKTTLRIVGEGLFSGFMHPENRPVGGKPDFGMHWHFVAQNFTWDPLRSRYVALEVEHIRRQADQFEADFHQRLMQKLDALGFELRQKGKYFEIAGVPDSLLKAFSRRRDQCDEYAKEHNLVTGKQRDWIGSATREGKAEHLPIEQLRAYWHSRMTPAWREAIAKVTRFEVPQSQRPDAAAAMGWAVRHLFEQQAWVKPKELVAYAVAHGLGNVTRGQAEQELAKQALIQGKGGHKGKVTARWVWEQETWLIDHGLNGRGTMRPINPGWTIYDPALNREQRAAVMHFAASRDETMLFVGDAGTGKSRTAEEIARMVRDSGQPFLALAPSAEASRGVLRESLAFPNADTVAKFLVSKPLQEAARGGIIFLDEAGMADMKTAVPFFQAAKAIGARVIVAGDPKQHGSPGRGDPLNLLIKYSGIPQARLTEIQRQKGEGYKEISRLASEFDPAVLDKLKELGWIKRPEDLAPDYVAATKGKDQEKEAVRLVIPVHARGQAVTDEIRALLKQEKRLGREDHELSQLVPVHMSEPEREVPGSYQPGDVLIFHTHGKGIQAGSRIAIGEAADREMLQANAAKFQVYRPATIPLAKGDKIRATANFKTLDGHRVDNGSIYHIGGFTEKGNPWLKENGWVLDASKGLQVRHGYYATSLGVQARTADEVLCDFSRESLGAMSREQTYVDLTRGRHKATGYTDDLAAVAKKMGHSERKATATDVLGAEPRQRQQRQRRLRHLAFLQRQAYQERLQQQQALDRARQQAAQSQTGRGMSR